MKNYLVFFFALIMISSCTPYKEFVSVQNWNDVPDGTQSIILTTSIDTLKEAFKNKGIMIKSLEGGFETEEIFLDEGTRAMYKVHEFDDNIRISAFWGITQKVKSQMTVWGGAAAASSYEIDTWDRVIYDNKSTRPKKVFDYAIQILEERKIDYDLK